MRVAEGLPDDMLRDVDHLKVDRRGAGSDAFMVTYEIVGHVEPGHAYCLGENAILNAPGEARSPVSAAVPGATPPPHLRLSGDWDSSVSVETEQANILGDVGILTLNTNEIVIPEAPATPEMLGYYGGRLLSAGEAFEFDADANLPVARMEIGAGYADGYLHVASKGGGSYLEHHDRPHLHVPLDEDAGGYLILGRRDGADYLVSGFRIPFGSAIYTPPEVLHADPYLIGNYLVVYSVTENFSNAVLRAPGGGGVSVRFAPLE
jgi:hypothetical protein